MKFGINMKLNLLIWYHKKKNVRN